MLKMIPLELGCCWDKFKFKKTCTLSKPSTGLGDARNTEMNDPGPFPRSPQPARYQVADWYSRNNRHRLVRGRVLEPDVPFGISPLSTYMNISESLDVAG